MRLNKIRAGSFAYSRLAQSVSRFGRDDKEFRDEVLSGELHPELADKKGAQPASTQMRNNNNPRSTLVIEKIVQKGSK